MVEKPVDIRSGLSMLEKKEKTVKLTGRKDDKNGVVGPMTSTARSPRGPYFNSQMMKSHLMVSSMDLCDLIDTFKRQGDAV